MKSVFSIVKVSAQKAARALFGPNHSAHIHPAPGSGMLRQSILRPVRTISRVSPDCHFPSGVSQTRLFFQHSFSCWSAGLSFAPTGQRSPFAPGPASLKIPKAALGARGSRGFSSQRPGRQPTDFQGRPAGAADAKQKVAAGWLSPRNLKTLAMIASVVGFVALNRHMTRQAQERAAHADKEVVTTPGERVRRACDAAASVGPFSLPTCGLQQLSIGLL